MESGCVQPKAASAGAPGCPVCTGQCPVRQTSAEQTSRSRVFLRRLRLKFTGLSGVHRTVRWANGRPRDRRATRGRANGRKGAPDCPVCTGLSGAPDLQRSATVGCARIGKQSAPDSVQCTTRQKARIAFLDCSQWLLAALGL